MNQLVIKCDEGDIVLDVDYDRAGKPVDFDKLDEDLWAIEAGKFDLGVDTFDCDAHIFESPMGKLVGIVLANVDAEIEI